MAALPVAALLLLHALGAPAAPRADAGRGAADPDQEIIDHLDELQRLELLQHLELLDPAGDETAPPPAPPATSSPDTPPAGADGGGARPR